MEARHDAASDRTQSSEDRKAGAGDRAHSEEDRNAAWVNRKGAATRRAGSELDRASAHADRAAAALDRENAAIDDLTGAYSRDVGLLELRREMERAKRTGQPLTLAFVDVDRLKTVNDSLGHAAGDVVLVEVVQAIRRTLRSYDLIVRYGGDEFLCVITGLDVAGAMTRLSGVSQALATPQSGQSVTIGVAAMSGQDTAGELIARADGDLYRQREERRRP